MATKLSRMENCLFSSQLFFVHVFFCCCSEDPSSAHIQFFFLSAGLYTMIFTCAKLLHLNTIGKWSFSGVIHLMAFFFSLCFRFFSIDEIVNCSATIFVSSSLNLLYVNAFFFVNLLTFARWRQSERLFEIKKKTYLHAMHQIECIENLFKMNTQQIELLETAWSSFFPPRVPIWTLIKNLHDNISWTWVAF